MAYTRKTPLNYSVKRDRNLIETQLQGIQKKVFHSLADEFKAYLREQSSIQRVSFKFFLEKFTTIVTEKAAPLNTEEQGSIGKNERHLLGSLITYFYQPIHHGKLPYYDQFPLTIVTDIKKNQIRGLNLHYLPVRERLFLFTNLLQQYGDLNEAEIEQSKVIDRSYYDMKNSFGSPNMLGPIFRIYRINKISSKVLVIPPPQWKFALTLNSEKFIKKSKTFVWSETMQKTQRQI